MRACLGCLCAGLLFAASGHAQTAAELDVLYETNQWFQLRDSIESDPAAPVFFRGAAELAFHQWEPAERDLRAAADAVPATVTVDTMDQASRAALAMKSLSDLYGLMGRYKEASAQFERFQRYIAGFASNALIGQAEARELRRLPALLAALAKFPNQSVERQAYSRLPYSASRGRPIVPVSVNGKSGRMLLDTGSDANFIGTSEARRLGLAIHVAETPLDAYDSVPSKSRGFVVANKLNIGNFQLRNVAFLLFDDDDDEIPALLGQPVLFALGTMRWSPGGDIEIGFPAATAGQKANLAATGNEILTEASLGGERLLLTVDTGADETLVYPRFAKALGVPPESSGKPLDRDILAKHPAVMHTAGFDARPASANLVFTRQTSDFVGDGNLGTDILGQGSSVTLDLVAMRLSVDSPAGHQTAEEPPPLKPPESAAPILPKPNLTDAELRELMKGISDEDLDFEPSRDYVYVDDAETRFLDAKGNVTSTNTETHESIVLYGERYEKLIAKDGKPLSSKDARSEQQKLDKETDRRKKETPEARSRRLAGARACTNEFLASFHFHSVGVESMNGRRAWKVEAEPIPGISAKCSGVKNARMFQLRIWVDQGDKGLAKIEADNVQRVTYGAILIRVPPGGLHVSEDLTRRDDGAWLPARTHIHIDLKLVLLKTFRIEILTTFRDYRKFQAESKIVEQ